MSKNRSFFFFYLFAFYSHPEKTETAHGQQTAARELAGGVGRVGGADSSHQQLCRGGHGDFSFREQIQNSQSGGHQEIGHGRVDGKTRG